MEKVYTKVFISATDPDHSNTDAHFGFSTEKAVTYTKTKVVHRHDSQQI